MEAVRQVQQDTQLAPRTAQMNRMVPTAEMATLSRMEICKIHNTIAMQDSQRTVEVAGSDRPGAVQTATEADREPVVLVNLLEAPYEFARNAVSR